MEYAMKFIDMPFQYDFSINKNKQNIMIDVLLKYSPLTLGDLAIILNVPLQTLSAIYDGTSFFKDDYLNNLIMVFLTFFSD